MKLTDPLRPLTIHKLGYSFYFLCGILSILKFNGILLSRPKADAAGALLLGFSFLYILLFFHSTSYIFDFYKKTDVMNRTKSDVVFLWMSVFIVVIGIVIIGFNLIKIVIYNVMN